MFAFVGEVVLDIVGTVVLVTLGTMLASYMLAPKRVPQVEKPMSESSRRVNDSITARVLATRANRKASRTSRTN